jgi:hypothetical protein
MRRNPEGDAGSRGLAPDAAARLAGTKKAGPAGSEDQFEPFAESAG